MELKCPQCGKLLTVSQEELVIHGSQVVCPQCLAVCRYEGNQLVVHDDSDAPYRRTTVVDKVADSTKFCHRCGKQLPGGISFCPYCGADLAAPFDQPKAAPTKPTKPAEVQQPAKPKPAPERPARVERPKPDTHVEDKLRAVSRRYNAVHPQLHQHGTMPSRKFKLVAYAIIALLVILFVCIIIAGVNIDTSVGDSL